MKKKIKQYKEKKFPKTSKPYDYDFQVLRKGKKTELYKSVYYDDKGDKERILYEVKFKTGEFRRLFSGAASGALYNKKTEAETAFKRHEKFA